MNYFLDVAINSLISLAVAYILWHFELWAAGDAKLFFVFSFLLPLKYYSSGAFPHFPALALLLNVFTFAFIFLVLRSLYVFFKELDILSLKFKGEAGMFKLLVRYIRKELSDLDQNCYHFFIDYFYFSADKVQAGFSDECRRKSTNRKHVVCPASFGLFQELWLFQKAYEKDVAFDPDLSRDPSVFLVEWIFQLASKYRKPAVTDQAFNDFYHFLSPIFVLLTYVQKRKKKKVFFFWFVGGGYCCNYF